MNILDLIERRQSSRVPFDPERKIPEDELQQILEAARWAPTAHNMQNFQIVVVDDRHLLEELSKIATEASRAFIEENYEQLSFSEEELKRKKVGLLATMFPPSWRTLRFEPAPPAANLAPAAQAGMGSADTHGPDRWVEPAPDASHAQTLLGGPGYFAMTAVLLVVLYDPRKRAPASEGGVRGMISLGCVLENVWLVAQSLGIGVHVQSLLAASHVEQEVKRILGVPQSLKVGFALRLGYPTIPPTYLRVRRNLEEFVHRNQFATSPDAGVAGDVPQPGAPSDPRQR
jgi:nitroreductase